MNKAVLAVGILWIVTAVILGAIYDPTHISLVISGVTGGFLVGLNLGRKQPSPSAKEGTQQ